MTDPIADMLTRVRNAVQAKHQKVDMPASRLKVDIARILKEEGYISQFKTSDEGGKTFLTLFLKYGPKGEKNHLPLAEADLKLKELFKALKDFGCAGRILCESPAMEEDALTMKKVWGKVK